MGESILLDWLLGSQPVRPVFPDAVRLAAAGAAREFGLPGRHIEGWRYTPVRRLESLAFDREGSSLESLEAALAELPDLGGQRLVFAGGRFVAELSTLESVPGLSVGNLAGRSDSDHPESPTWQDAGDTFVCVNAAAATDGAYIAVEDDVEVAHPIHLVVLQDGSPAAHLYHSITVGDGAQVTIVEHYLPAADQHSLINTVNRTRVGRKGRLSHVRLQQAAERNTLLIQQQVDVHADGHYDYFSQDLGGDLVRTDLKVALVESGAHCDLAGLYLTRDRQLVDNHLTVEHRKPDTTSSMNFKGVLNDHSTGVFNGRVLVEAGADGTDATQSNDNLVLSRDAQINTKPELEIYADDVKCAHGTTVGQLDEAALFYLRSRGISRRAARNLLTYAFCTSLLDDFSITELKEFMIAGLVARLPEPDAIEDLT